MVLLSDDGELLFFVRKESSERDEIHSIADKTVTRFIQAKPERASKETERGRKGPAFETTKQNLHTDSKGSTVNSSRHSAANPGVQSFEADRRGLCLETDLVSSLASPSSTTSSSSLSESEPPFHISSSMAKLTLRFSEWSPVGSGANSSVTTVLICHKRVHPCVKASASVRTPIYQPRLVRALARKAASNTHDRGGSKLAAKYICSCSKRGDGQVHLELERVVRRRDPADVQHLGLSYVAAE